MTAFHESYWRGLFAGGIELTRLPLQRSRPPVSSFIRESVVSRIDTDTLAKLEGLTAQPGVAVQTAILAAIHSVVRRYAEPSRTIIGVTGLDVFDDGLDILLPTRVEWSLNGTASGRDLIQRLMVDIADGGLHREVSVRTMSDWFGIADALGSRLFNVAVAFRRSGCASRYTICRTRCSTRAARIRW